MNKFLKNLTATIFTMSTVLSSMVAPINTASAADTILGGNTTGYLNENDLGGTVNIATVSKTTSGYTYEKLNGGLGGKETTDYYAHYRLEEGVGGKPSSNHKFQPYTNGGTKVWNGSQYLVATCDFYPVAGVNRITFYAGGKGEVKVLSNVATLVNAGQWNTVKVVYRQGYYKTYINDVVADAWNDTQDTTVMAYAGNVRLSFSTSGDDQSPLELYLDNVLFKLVDTIDDATSPFAGEPTPTPSATPTATPTIDPDADLVVDSGFEEADVGTAISLSTASQTGVYFVSGANSAVVTDEKACSGTHSLKVTPDGGTDHWPGANQYVSLQGGQIYQGSVDIYIGDETGGAKSGDPYVRFTDLGDETTTAFAERGSATISACKGQWVHLVTYYQPTNSYAKARINISMPQGYVVYVDNLSVKAIESIPTPTPTPTPDPSQPTPTPTPTPDPNAKPDMVTGGDFESFDVGTTNPSGFNKGSDQLEVVDTYALSGSHSLKVTPDRDDETAFAGLNCYFTAEQGKKYVATVSMMVDPADVDNCVGNSAYIRFCNTNNKMIGRASFDGDTVKAGWQTIQSEVYTPDATYNGSKDDSRLNISFYNKAVQYVDDIHIYEISETVVDVTNVVIDGLITTNGDAYIIKPTTTSITLPYTNKLVASSITSDGITVNGSTLDTSIIGMSLDENKLTLTPTSLTKGAVYAITLSSGSLWKDEYNAAIEPQTIILKVSNDVYVGGLKLYDSTGFEAEGILGAGTYTAKATNLINTTDQASSTVLFMVLYKDGKIVDTALENISVNASDTLDSSEVSLTVPSGTGYVLKGFIWDSIENAISLCNHVEME